MFYGEEEKTAISKELRRLNVPSEERERFLSRLKPLRLSKDEFLEREGERPEKIALILSGLFRAFYLTMKGEEKTIVFREKGRVLSAYSSFLAETACQFSLQALEESAVLYLTIGEFEELRKHHHCWDILRGDYYLNIYREKEARERDLLSGSAKTNYLNFLREYPGLINRINHYHVASYLGISPVTLSRIRKELSHGQETE
ncbi:MAG: Crp/Fnr family transcriptional regulator [Spirochaetales bacterium]|nr:Crp/Fnr family transcriptional regulator [Spirochaetales bacterium]